MRYRLLFVLLILGIYSFSVWAEVSPPENIYYVQLGAYPTESEAQARKTELEAMGFSPLKVVYIAPWFKLWFGEFEYYLDAYIYKELIRGDVEPGAFVISQPNSEGKNSFAVPSSPYPSIFSPPESNLTEAPHYTLSFDDPLTSPLLPLLERGEQDAYIPKDPATAKPLLEQLVQLLPDTNPHKGWAMTRLGVIALQSGEYAKARSYFLPVVNGRVSARPLERIKAMRRVAWTYHIEGDRLTAYRAYRELERFTGSELVRAIARMECAGLLMEFARCGKGSLADCRRECQKVLASTPTRFKKQRATAELMYMESYYFEQDYEQCIELSEDFFRSYSDCIREYSAGLCMVAQAYGRMRRYDESINLLLKLRALNIPPEERFYHFDLQKWAVRWLVWNYDCKGDHARANYWRQFME
ncbi:SPOR domain-containing protein [Candidatus Sumerlaeota bacterium]|nr:SPOR domain-containing protein [Candidatus Sumerlaeota bacterium]